jgi:hypothetical protein
MKSLAAALALSFLAAGVASAQTPKPPVTGEPETVYSDAQWQKDSQLARRFVQSLMKPSFNLEGQFSRWKVPVCPHVVGLKPTAAYVIERRIREVAAAVGAPLDRRDPCKANIVIFVSEEPKTLLEAMTRQQRELFEASPMREMQDVRYPVQAWYFGYIIDWYGHRQMDIDCWLEAETCGSVGDAFGSRLRNGMHSEMAASIILADAAAINGQTLGSLGDYLALMSLSQAPATGRCQSAPSVANLFLKDCGADFHVSALSDVDLAMLKALYQTEEQPEKLEMIRLIGNMRRNLESGGTGK